MLSAEFSDSADLVEEKLGAIVFLDCNLSKTAEGILLHFFLLNEHDCSHNFLHDKVPLCLYLEVRSSVRNTVEHGFDRKFSWLYRTVWIYVIGKSNYDVIFELVGKITRLQLLTDIAKSCE